jgi:hypothetical protein
MNQLTKLIEQYEEATGLPAFEGDINGNCDFYKNFVKWLASRPTCGDEQRKFLDEIEKLNNDKQYAILIDTNFWRKHLPAVIKGE